VTISATCSTVIGLRAPATTLIVRGSRPVGGRRREAGVGDEVDRHDVELRRRVAGKRGIIPAA
jgi:hypothetical protein